MTTIQDTQTAGSEYQPVDGLLLEASRSRSSVSPVPASR